jgi:signal transduction histidine kinase
VPVGEIERLLRPFHRAGLDRTTHDEGSGLGLSIVQAIAIAHDANLVLRPGEEGGLRIEISFPVSTSHDE